MRDTLDGRKQQAEKCMKATGPVAPDLTLNLHGSYLQDLGRIGGSHETSRQFYVSVISALFVFLSMTGSTGALVTIGERVQQLVGAFGVVVCVLWFLHMRSFARLYDAKRKV